MQTRRRTILLVGFSTLLFFLITLIISCGHSNKPQIVNVAGAWSGMLTTSNVNPGPVQGTATLNLNQSSTGILTGTFAPQIGDLCPFNVDLPVTGQIAGTNISLSGKDDRILTSASIQAVVDPSSRQMKGTFGITLDTLCGDDGTIVLARQ